VPHFEPRCDLSPAGVVPQVDVFEVEAQVAEEQGQ
jgi:hypothetical protein